MKKVFFVALLAIVAVGGAISTQAQGPVYQDGVEYDCTGGSTACSSALNGTVFLNESETPGTGIPATSLPPTYRIEIQ